MSKAGFSPSKNWRERGYRKPGHKKGIARIIVRNRFGLTYTQARKMPVAQIVRIADNAAIRVLLGCTVKAMSGETWPVPDLGRKYLEEAV